MVILRGLLFVVRWTQTIVQRFQALDSFSLPQGWLLRSNFVRVYVYAITELRLHSPIFVRFHQSRII